MKSSANNRIFFALIVGVIFCVILVLLAGKNLNPDIFENLKEGYKESINFHFLDGILSDSLAVLAFQIVFVILLARGLGYVIGKIGQPFIVAEIVAGILVGPSVLGAFFPDLYSTIFPSWSIDNLKIVSQFGLVLFMFIIGMELDVKVLKSKGKTAMAVSQSSILASFLLGILSAYFLYAPFAPRGVTFFSFSIFIGIAFSMTAFALLSRSIQERMLTKTSIGNLALTSAAIDDITVWCIFALVIVFFKAGSWIGAVYPILFGSAYIALMFYVVQPILRKIGSVYASREIFNKRIIGVVFLILLFSTYAAEVLGIHALFGAFLAGLVMPQNLVFKKIIIDKVEDLCIVLLLPLFFVFVGLHTRLNTFDSVSWGVSGLLIVTAIVAKLTGSAFAARHAGHIWKESLSLGMLMNTRGVMTLIVLNIGYDLGIISTTVFSMMVLVTLVSAMAVGPALDMIDRLFRKTEPGAEVSSHRKTSFKILVSFGAPKMGSTLLRLADQLTMKHNKNVDITALHITPSKEVKPYEALLYEKEGFQPIKSTAQLLGQKINTIYRNTEDVDKEIVYTVVQGNYDLVLVGAARTVFNDRITGGKLRQLLEEGQTNIGVLVDRGFVLAESILLLLGSENDLPLLQYALRFRTSNQARVTILKMGDGQAVDLKNPDLPSYNMMQHFREVIEQRIPDKHLLSHFNLILVSLEHWNELNEMRASWIKDCPSILVVKHHRDLVADGTPENVVVKSEF